MVFPLNEHMNAPMEGDSTSVICVNRSKKPLDYKPKRTLEEASRGWLNHLEETLPNSPFADGQLYTEGPHLFFPRTFNAEAYWTKVSKGRINARYISPFAIILHEKGEYPKIGKGTWIGHFCVLDGSQGLVIGENCEISCGAHIYTHSTAKRCVLGETKETAPVDIEDSVFIGPNSIVSMGCRIGAHSIIGSLSLLEKHTVVAPYTFWVGIPAKFKKDVRRLK